MRVLIIKTSSLGDVIHTLPALTDAAQAIPSIRFDWLVEEAFKEVPEWHAAVDRVIPMKLRKWRRHPFQAWRSGEWQQCKQRLAAAEYDAVIDAQGLLKSAWMSRYSKGPCYGFDSLSAREPMAARFYQHKIGVAKNQHAVERTRQLFAEALGYPVPQQIGDSGITRKFRNNISNTIVLLHGTTWANKHWPEPYWQQLGEWLTGKGFKVQLPWGSRPEYERAQRIAANCHGEVLVKQSLTGLAGVIGAASACIGVDTGLGHLASAIGTPSIALFGPTNPGLTGFYGEHQKSLQADYHCAPCLQRKCRHADEDELFPPCFTRVKPQLVADTFSAMMQREGQ